MRASPQTQVLPVELTQTQKMLKLEERNADQDVLRDMLPLWRLMMLNSEKLKKGELGEEKLVKSELEKKRKKEKKDDGKRREPVEPPERNAMREKSEKLGRQKP